LEGSPFQHISTVQPLFFMNCKQLKLHRIPFQETLHDNGFQVVVVNPQDYYSTKRIHNNGEYQTTHKLFKTLRLAISRRNWAKHILPKKTRNLDMDIDNIIFWNVLMFNETPRVQSICYAYQFAIHLCKERAFQFGSKWLFFVVVQYCSFHRDDVILLETDKMNVLEIVNTWKSQKAKFCHSSIEETLGKQSMKTNLESVIQYHIE